MLQGFTENPQISFDFPLDVWYKLTTDFGFAEAEGLPVRVEHRQPKTAAPPVCAKW